jgi:hypothetical protein
MEALFPSAPAAASPPPASDAKAWAPHGTQPAGAVPDATPYAPVAMPDMDSLSPQARHEFQQAVRAGTREAFEAWARKHAGQQNAGVPQPPSPGTTGAEVGGQPPSPSATGTPAEDVSPERTALAEQLATHGSDIQAVDLLLPEVDRYHERLSAMSDDEMAAGFEQGEANVISRVFRGDEAAYERAVRQIGDIARKVGGEKLVKGIAESCVLLDPELFLKVHCMANAIAKGAPK